MVLKFVAPLVPLLNAAEVVWDAFRDEVPEPAIGSVVYCDLAAGFGDHTGIYIGDHEIVHLNGDGWIEKVSPTLFVSRLGGYNTAMNIYVSCRGTSPVGSAEVAKRARMMVGKRRKYSLLFDNCHQFTAGCLTGNYENSCNFMRMVKSQSERHLGSDNWRTWVLKSWNSPPPKGKKSKRKPKEAPPPVFI